MSFLAQRYLGILVAVVLGGLAVIQAGNPADFGMSPIQAHWLAVFTAMLGLLAGFLPSPRNMAADPDFLVRRIEELPTHQQIDIATVLADRATLAGHTLPTIVPVGTGVGTTRQSDEGRG